jgi:hypothetical protein
VTARRTVVWSLAVFALVRVAQVAGVVLAPQRHGRSTLDLLTKADGLVYLGIAQNGYAPLPPIGANGIYTKPPDLAFFPLYPATIRVLSWAVDPRLAAVLAALVAGAVATVLMTLWAIPRTGEVGAITLVAIWSLWPSSVVLSMGYSEALFTATVAGCLLALQRGAWVWAAVACALGGLTRPVGAALLAALVAALLVRRPPLRSWLPAVVVAPLGLLVSLGHVALVTGRWDGWFWMERTVWRSGFDGGSSFLRAMRSMLPGGTSDPLPVWVVSGIAVAVGLVLLVWLLLSRPPVEEWVFALLAFVMGVGGANYVHCKPRFLLPVLPLFAAPSRALSRLPVPALAVVGAVALGLSVWWAAYLLVVWPFSL